MISLIKKEIRLFFCGPSAYLIGAIFFVVNACVLFILPNQYNLFDSGFASLSGFFEWMPLVFLFLIPALCMRSFSEEKKSGTLESLLTRPISDMAVVAGKWISIFIILLILLLPAFLYRYSISFLAAPVGNIDIAAFWGAFMGTILLGAASISVSIFMSACTRNQMIAFISSVVVCAAAFWGFEAVSRLPFFGRFDLQIASLGMDHHYKSLSRGVIDIRDVLYYLSFAAVFYWATVRMLQKRINTSPRSWIYVIGVILVLEVLVHLWPGRWDLTSDKRYTLIPISKEILKSNDSPVLVKIYLTGDLPAGFKQLEKSAKELLDEFRIYHPSLRYQFVDIYASENEKSKAIVDELIQKGLEPTQLEVKTKEGMVRRLIFPCAEVAFDGKIIPVSLLLPQLGQSAQETLNRSVENLELQFINAIRILFDPPSKKIAFLEGHGELSYQHTVYAGKELSLFYKTERLALTDTTSTLSDYELLIMAKPVLGFSESEKYLLDQYIMNGGKMLWLISPNNAQMDSLRTYETFLAQPEALNLDDIWFRYGFRVNKNIVLDMNSCPTPIVTGHIGQQPVIEFIPNIYRPILMPIDSLTGIKVDPLSSEFPASIDTISNSVRKEVLLITSNYSHKIKTPHVVASDLMRDNMEVEMFKEGPQNVSWWLEGKFESAFKAIRPASQAIVGYKSESKPTVMVVIADGNIIKNELDYKTGMVFPTGYDRYENRLYGNLDFITNVVHRMCGHSEWIHLKNRKVSWRLLDAGRVDKWKNEWSWINMLLPVVLLAGLGLGIRIERRKRFKE